ncbi:hypothetical protein [Sorangium cellulosum]|nr:hypothetical protein [Sorangium cellulosum]
MPLLIVSLQFFLACAPELRLGDLPGSGAGGGGGAGSGEGGSGGSEASGGLNGAAGGGGAGSGAADGVSSSAGGGAGGRDCASDSSCLADDGLVARYFLDDPAIGLGHTQVEDAAEAPLSLALTHDVDMGFADDARRGGLVWTAAETDSRASAAIDGTKIHGALHASRTGTIEAVFSVSEVSAEGSRIVHIGSGTESGRFTLRSEALGQIELWWNGVHCGGAWEVPPSERVVVHGVLDTTVPEPAEVAQNARVLLDNDDSPGR